MKLLVLTAPFLAALLLANTAGAQSFATDGLTLWGGLSSEKLTNPGALMGVSLPIASTPNLNVALRGSLGAYFFSPEDTDVGAAFVIPEVNADLLLSSAQPGNHFYGGPSVGVATDGAWLLGGVAGVRGQFGSSAGKLGWYGEARARKVLASNTTDFSGISGGLGLGLTFRF